MKAIMPVALPDVMAHRKRVGNDKWDEMWNGVLHMPPMPNRVHQEFEWHMETYLRRWWASPRKAKVYHQINLASPGGWPDKDYRIPDLVLLSPERFGIDHNEYFEGAPDVVVEIHSPGDEAYDKLEFYAELGVPEVWIIDRDTREPEIHLLSKGKYRKQRADTNGWLRSPGTGVEMRQATPDKLAVRVDGDDTTQEELPAE